MSKFYNLEGQSVVVEAALDDLRPVEEGWGYAVAKVLGTLAAADVAAFIGAIFSFGILAIPGAIIGGLKGWKFINLKASEQLVSLLNKDDIKKYIIEECDKKFKELKKKNKNLTLDVDAAMKNSEKLKEVSQDNRGPVDKFFTNFGKCTTKIGNYTIMATGDSDSFDGLHVVFFDTEADKLIRESIPVPTAKTVGESMEVAEEGWGTAILKAVGVYGSGVACIALGTMLGAGVPGLIAGMFAGFKAMKAIDMAANKDLKKLLERADIKSFIEKEADKAFKEAKKENKNLVLEVEEALKNVQHMDEAEEDARSWITKYFTKLARCFLTVGKYTVIATGDLDSVDTLYLLMFDKEANKVVKKQLPLPVIKKEAE